MFDPYSQWLGLSPLEIPPTPFQMIGLMPGSYSAAEIHVAAEKQIQNVRQHQQGPQGFRALKLIGEILEARDALLDPAAMKNYVPAPVPAPTDDQAWYREEKAPAEPPKTAALEIVGPDLSEAKTKNWWVGEGGDTAPAEAISDRPKASWWTDPEAREVEPIEVPPPLSVRVRDLPVVEPKVVAARQLEFVEPEPERGPRNTQKMLLIGGFVAALMGVGVVVFLMNQKPTSTSIVPPKDDLVQNTNQNTNQNTKLPEKVPEPAKEIAKEPEKERPKIVEQPKLVVAKKAPVLDIKEPRNYRIHTGAVWGVAVSRDGSEFFSVGLDKQLFARQLEEQKSLLKHQFLAGGLQVIHGSAMNLLVACDASQVVVFDPDAKLPRRKIVTPSGGFRSMALHPNGALLLTGSSDGLLRWWNIPDDKLESTLEVIPGKEISSLALSPDGALAMAGTVDGRVFLIDMTTRKVVHSLQVHTKKVTAVAISPNGERGVSVSEDKFVQLWDLTKKSLTRKLEVQPEILLGVGWSSDSRRVMICGLEPVVKMYDANNGKLLWAEKLGEKSYSLAIDSQDRFVLLGGEQGTIQMFPLPRISTEDIPKDIVVKPPPDKLTTPGIEEVKLARVKVRERYAADFERRLPAEIASLIDKLLQQGLTVKHEPAYRQALFDEAAELAQVGRLLDDAMKVAEGRAQWFLSDELDEKTQAIEFISTKAPNPQQRAIAERAIDVLVLAQKADRYELVERLLKVAEDSARFSGIKELIDRTGGVKKQVAGILMQKSRVLQARTKLQTMPDDPESNYLWGRSLCLIQTSWPTGLAHLAKGNDEKWKTAAKLDLSEPKDAPTQYKLAGNWFEIAGTVSEDEKANAFARARLWYERSLESGLTGTDKVDALTKVRNIKAMK